MKKIICLSVAILFAVIVKSQNTCLDATIYVGNAHLPIPPSGTISPTGPDLGCLLITTRQVWVVFPVCRDFYLSTLNINTYSTGYPDSLGAVFYGPIPQKGNCADLTAAKIMACENTIASSSGFGNFIDVFDTLHAGNYYYLLMTFSDGLPSPVWVSWSNSVSDCYQCNNQVSPLDNYNLCMVSVDTSINKCVLTWEEFSGPNLLGYKISRETTLTGVYDSITTVPLGSMSTYTDMSSSPSQHNYTYAVRAVDSCGQSYPVQNTLTSIHLISYSGGNNEASLVWNNVYTSSTFIPQYYIYRNNNGSGWQVIDSIGITLPTITYTDIFAPAGINRYTVELRKLVPCVPMRVLTNPYQSVFSNTSQAIVTGTEEFFNHSGITISPNPFTDELIITNKNNEEGEIILYDIAGRTVARSFLPFGEFKWSLQLSKGMYLYEVRNAQGVVKKGKVVKD